MRSQIDASNWKEAYTWADGLGRAIKSQSVDTESGDVFVETTFDAFGRPWKTSNPYRTGETVNWTANTFDSAGRPWKVTTPDSAIVETAYGLATVGSCIGTTVTVEDQADNQRRSVTNALGQLCRVDEPTTTGTNLGAITSPNQPTNYSYDLLNNLTTVSQGIQTRTFNYDALSRLKSATNPESGTINYTYDDNNNLATKIDARNITTNYTYDKLNRVTLRAYANEPAGSETADVSYFYDNLANAKGKLIKVQNTNSTTEYTAFDILGRVTAAKQTTDGGDPNGYTTGYVYNLRGALIEETYPSGRVLKNTLDNDGMLQQGQSRRANDTFRNYANAFQYNAAGAVTAMRLGNGKWETTQFNSRLQPTQIGLGASASSQNLLKLNYTYNTAGNADNNGNVLSQTITVPTVGANQGFTATQTYTYDSINRLNDAKEMIGTTETWKQTFLYDRYGNRTFDTTLNRTTTIPTGCPTAVCNPSANPSDNKLKTSDGYLFDNSGNTTTDAENRTFIYDGENKQVEVRDSTITPPQNDPDANLIGRYWYDGNSKRVKKYVPPSGTNPGETTIFVYDAAGKLVAEYSTIVEPVSTAKVSYLTNDHLGSPRITTDAIGQTISRRDFMPFGEEISRTNYGSDSVRQKFTGYERDNETELDFAQARMFASSHGRFTGVDPYNIIFETEDAEKEKEGEGKKLFNGYISQPQNWNRYVYVWNNPLKNTDPNGEKVYVVLYTTGNSESEENLKRAAETQAATIRNDGQFDPKKDTVLIKGVRTKDDVQNALNEAAGLEKNFGKIEQLQLFSHAGPIDGPTFHPPGTGNAANGVQWTNAEITQLRVNWAPGAQAYFFGCRTADWAQKFANAQNVTAYGYDRFAYFSSSRDARTGPNTTGPLYLIAADGGKNGFWGGVRHAVGYASVYPMVRKDPNRRR